MRNLKSIVIVFLAVYFFSSCEKEYSLENGLPATGSLKSATTGDCLPSTLNGIFKETVALTATNYLDVQVDVLTGGPYSITSDTINGYYFIASGVFTSTGLTTVRLAAAGTPLAVGTNVFSIRFNTSRCSVAVNIVPANTSISVFTFTSGSGGDCSGAVLNGTYTPGTALGIDNTVTLSIDVTTAGTYTISTPTVNGISFSAMGVFTSTGVQTILLKGNGTPLAAGTQNFSPTGAGNTCAFSVTVSGSTTGTKAVYTLTGAGGACTGATLSGTYNATVAMTATNTVKLAVDVTTVGAYTIVTPAVNGVTFIANGSFTATGAQTVTLTASGTPTAAGTLSYAATGDATTSCNFTVDYLAAPASASYTLKGSASACINATVNGTLQAGTAASAANTITVLADVTSPGSYNIVTTTVNGITYAASGVFANAGGSIEVNLVATGTPVAEGVFTYSLTGNGSTCTVDVTVQPAVDGVFTAKIDGVFTAFNFDRSVTNEQVSTVGVLEISGYDAAGNAFDFSVQNLSGAVTTGTYNEKGFNSTNGSGHILTATYYFTDASGTDQTWGSESNIPGEPDNPPFTIIITSITATRVQGTFSGQVAQLPFAGTTTKNFTEGTFDLPIQ